MKYIKKYQQKKMKDFSYRVVGIEQKFPTLLKMKFAASVNL